ncbi:hypothetical protein MYX07_03190 [Patescibacteria group bacterium AH-259-L07]|nr:hypothetical protein [Patescibacteria group bacterium AH-259-L07]
MRANPNISFERKYILDLLILITAITGLVNFFTDWSITQSLWIRWVIILLLIFLVTWRILKSPLFSFEKKVMLPLMYIYDKKNRTILGMEDMDTPYFHAWCGFQELLRKDKGFRNILPIETDKGIGSDEFRNKMQDVFEYSILATMSGLAGWKIKNEVEFFGYRSSNTVEGGIKIKYDDLPKNLKNKNIVLKSFKEEFMNEKEIKGLTWIKLSVPPKINMNYEDNRLVYKNKFIEFKIGHSVSGVVVGTPLQLLKNSTEEQGRFITFMCHLSISAKLNPILALCEKAEFYGSWAMQYIERLSKRILMDEESYRKEIIRQMAQAEDGS